MERFYSHAVIVPYNLPGMDIYDFKLKDNVVKQVNWRKKKILYPGHGLFLRYSYKSNNKH